MKYLMVGLGNPGAEYEETRHNIGFKVVDSSPNVCPDLSRPADWARCPPSVLRDVTLCFQAVDIHEPEWQGCSVLDGRGEDPFGTGGRHHGRPELPFGTLRLRAKGSDGGHNGLKDIQDVLATTKYPRLRFGIGAEFGKGQQVDYVLGKWSAEEQERMDERLTKAGDAVLNITTAGLARAMNAYNGQ